MIYHPLQIMLLFATLTDQARHRVEGCPYVFHRYGERIQSFRKAWHTACKQAGCDSRLFHDLRRSAVRNLIRAGVPQSIAMKISGHKDARIFARYNIVDTRDVGEAMRKLLEYEQEKRIARAKRITDLQAHPTLPAQLYEVTGLEEKHMQ